ncbi:MAG: tryptophanase [Candidatus Izemoplasmatales bacterium]|uniref:Tryptophanase n=1 Tax=Hujiaoplasma nucleasis TaxID=2725268 RepID=A0A7L6N833_9MOLU|nr:tryptophanase [Hujiaoplasma nucleasis]QLY40689.1 tryptophanase [Hujiaoplasma nucleasis]
MENYQVPPYKIKMVEPIKLITKSQRINRLKEAGYNPFRLKSEDVFIDLLTDSGTGAMSHFQWGALMQGDEAYAGSRSFYRLEKVVKDITGYKYVIPAHQGRGAEQVVLPLLIKEGMTVISNIHFDTTRAHVELAGGRAVDCACKECFDLENYHPFKGNFDLDKLKTVIKEKGKENIAAIIMTITNNSAGGQPVSLENMRAVNHIARENHIPIVIDGARYAENSFYIKQREKGYENKSIRAIALETFALADIFLMSSKKDGLVNIGGLIAIKDNLEIFQKAQVRVIPMEGFPTYGGLSGRDMDALAIGLQEALDEDYLRYRIDEIRYLGDLLKAGGVPIQYPTGGHAVFVDCGAIVPHIPFDEFPAQAVCNELYIEGGIRGVEIGSLLLGRDPDTHENLKADKEFLRLTIPRRTYTYDHLRYVAETMIKVYKRRHKIKGLKFTYESPILRHFTAKFEPIE